MKISDSIWKIETFKLRQDINKEIAFALVNAPRLVIDAPHTGIYALVSRAVRLQIMNSTATLCFSRTCEV